MADDGAPIGRHALLDLSGAGRLSDAPFLEQVIRAAANAAGAHVIGANFHHFGEGHGVTGVLLLAESHISVHTWPEHDFAAFDLFLCGQTRMDAAVEAITQAFPKAQANLQVITRGVETPD